MRHLVLLSMLAPHLALAQSSWPVQRAPFLIASEAAADGSPQFTSAVSATRLPSGEVVIADAADGTLRVADARGRVVRSIGRSGKGPGEFTMLVWVGRCGESLYTWDMQAARVSVFDPANGFVRQFMVPGTASSLTAACSDAGALAAFTMPGSGGPAAADETGKTSNGTAYEVRRMLASVVLTDTGGTEQGRIPGVLWAEMIAGRLSPNGGFGALPRPLGGQTSFAFLGDRVVVARSDSGSVSIHDQRGNRTGGFVVQGEREAPTKAQYARAIPPAIAIIPRRMHEMVTAFAHSVPMPAQAPAFTRLLTDRAGLIWLVTSLAGDPVTRLRAVREDGNTIATVDIPVAMSVYEIGDDYVLGRTENADGEVSVVAYRFRRSSSAP